MRSSESVRAAAAGACRGLGQNGLSGQRARARASPRLHALPRADPTGRRKKDCSCARLQASQYPDSRVRNLSSSPPEPDYGPFTSGTAQPSKSSMLTVHECAQKHGQRYGWRESCVGANGRRNQCRSPQSAGLCTGGVAGSHSASGIDDHSRAARERITKQRLKADRAPVPSPMCAATNQLARCRH
jgi:hypothetical protein